MYTSASVCVCVLFVRRKDDDHHSVHPRGWEDEGGGGGGAYDQSGDDYSAQSCLEIYVVLGTRKGSKSRGL